LEKVETTFQVIKTLDLSSLPQRSNEAGNFKSPVNIIDIACFPLWPAFVVLCKCEHIITIIVNACSRCVECENVHIMHVSSTQKFKYLKA